MQKHFSIQACPRHYPVYIVCCQVVHLHDFHHIVAHISYRIAENCTTLLIEVMHAMIYSKARWRTNRTTSLHMKERQAFTISTQV